jgi:hypothetical protein
VDLFDDLAVHLLADQFDHAIRHGSHLPAEVHDADDILRMFHGPHGCGRGEAREEVAGEECLDKPDLSALGDALEFDAWAVSLDIWQAEHEACGKVLALRSGVDDIPSGGFRKLHVPEVTWGQGSGQPQTRLRIPHLCASLRTLTLPCMFKELHDYLYHLSPTGGLPMKPVGILLGLALLVTHLWAWRNADKAKAFLRSFPRHYGWGVALLTIDFFWSMMVLSNMDMGEFFFLRKWFLTLVPIGFVLVLIYVKEFLSVRALGSLMLLVSGVVLAAAFLQPPVTRLLLPVLAYAWIISGMFFVGMPFLMRDWTTWLLAKEGRWSLVVWGGIGYGAALLVLAVLTY